MIAASVLLWSGLVSAAPAMENVDHKFTVRLWGSEEGLPQLAISSFAQTLDGFLWFSTFDGVVRFDGARSIRFSSTELTIFAPETVFDPGLRLASGA